MSVFGFMPEQQKIKEVEINELDQYIKLNPIDMEQDSLVWWKNNSFQYPIVSQISKTVLNIQGTSSESERLLSKTGIILNKQRGMLSGKHLNELLFLSNNLYQIDNKNKKKSKLKNM